MSTSTKKSATSLSATKPVFDPDGVLMNRMTAAKLVELFDDFERPARMWLQRQGLNAEHETQCFALWLDRKVHEIRNPKPSIGMTHQAFA